jgi:hypothetical protein
VDGRRPGDLLAQARQVHARNAHPGRWRPAAAAAPGAAALFVSRWLASPRSAWGGVQRSAWAAADSLMARVALR